MGGYPDLNRELTAPHAAVLPFELYPPYILYNLIYVWITRLELVWYIPPRPKRDLTTNSSISMKNY
jgi:hypothetical protein